MTDPSHLPATIRARVHDGAIDRVTRFFDAGLAQAFTLCGIASIICIAQWHCA